MARRKNPDQLASSFASETQRQFNQLKAALQSAESGLSHLRSTLRVPVIRPPRGRIRGSRSTPSIFTKATESSIGGFLSREILSGGGSLIGDLFGDGDGSDIGGGSFSQSATQFAAKLLDASARGQRIR